MPEVVRDRYAIYSMAGKFVRAKLPQRLGGRRIEGVVGGVYRDPFARRIEVRVGKSTFAFREPDVIEASADGKAVALVYGVGNAPTDEEFFAEYAKGGGAEQAFRALDREHFAVRFRLSEAPVLTGKRAKNRKKVPNSRKPVRVPSGGE